MAGASVPFGRMVRWDRGNGELYWTDESGSQQRTTWHEATDGKVWSVGPRLHFREYKNQIRWTATGHSDSSVMFLEDAKFMVMNPSKREDVNNLSNIPGSWLVTYGGSFKGPHGEDINVRDGISWASPAGKRLLINSAVSERMREIYLEVQEPGAEVLPSTLPPGYRMATADEATDRAVAASLWHDYGKELKDLAAEGIYDPTGTRIEDSMGIAFYAIHKGDIQTTAFNSAVFDYSGMYDF